MTARPRRVAILFPADPVLQLATPLEASRFAETAKALGAANLEVVAAPYADAIVEDIRERLVGIDAVLVWLNPIEGGRDRTILNAMLREIASNGALVSAHPDVIDRIGTKEVLYRTRHMTWGTDTRHYTTVDALRTELPAVLALGAPRVLKQIRGQSGDGVWKIELAEHASFTLLDALSTPVRVREAKRGSPEVVMPLGRFIAAREAHFTTGGGLIDQAYQARLPEGMVRCYLVRDRVAGFGEQRINMLHPPPDGHPASAAPLPGPRLYYPPTRADFQKLKHKLEHDWVGELCRSVGLDRSQLPVLWDADFLYGPKDGNDDDTFVLCEINVSSVYPFPPEAMGPLVAETLARIELGR